MAPGAPHRRFSDKVAHLPLLLGWRGLAGIRVTVRHRVLEFLASYGEKGYNVLRAAVEATLNSPEAGVRLGDFSYREVVRALRSRGVEYNPSMLLRILERDYGVIETSYHSGNQHWWRFVDLAAVVDALEDYERGEQPEIGGDLGEEDEGGEEEPVLEDPRITVLQAQFAALGIDEVYEKLEKLALKPRLSKQDRLVFSKIAFEYLDLIASLYEKMSEYEDVFREELEVLAKTLRLASQVARKMALAQKTRVARKTPVRARPAIAEPGRPRSLEDLL